MCTWYVSTSKKSDESRDYGLIWIAEDFDSEEEARAFASSVLSTGVRVEAGTLPGVWPTVRVSWRRAQEWALSY